MIYSKYGQTGAMVSAVGFGGMRFDTSRSNEENAELLLYARSRGINYFDTAPGYCDDKSEDIFGIAFKQMAGERGEIYISTKGMPTECDTAKKARLSVERSLKRLNVEKIDFYHVWCLRKMEHYELAMQKGGQYEGLLKCREEGLIGNIVASTHLPGRDICRIIERGEFAGVLMGVNVLNFLYRWEGVKAACETGLGVVAMNPLAGGMIAQHADKLGFLAGDGETPVEAALRFCISCPQITVTLNGFTTKKHIDMACRIADQSREFSESDIERVRDNISENMNSICTGCGYCMSHCPQNIPISNYMQCYNEMPLSNKSDSDMVELMKFHQEWGLLVDCKAGAGQCERCGECEQACTQHLDIMDRLEKIDEWEKQIT